MAIFTGHTRKRRSVRIVSVGDRRVLMCPPGTITLNAILNDTTNLRNHTFKWVQTKGNSITLQNADTLTATFPHSDSSDKTFRFYLNYGTNKEQFKDVEIYYTPTTLIGNSTLRSEKNDVSATLPNIQKTDGLLFLSVPGEFQAPINAVYGTKFTFDIPIQDSVKTYHVKSELLTGIGFTANPDIVYKTYGKSEFPTTFTVPQGTYLFKVYAKYPGTDTKVFTSKLLVALDKEATGITGVADLVDVGSINSELIKLQRKRTILYSVLDQIPNTRYLENSSTVKRFSIKTVDSNQYPALSDTIDVGSYSSQLIAIQRNDINSIGGN